MRVSLAPDQAEFIKQIADLRRFLNRLEATGKPEDAMKARFMTGVLVPFLNVMRSELRTEGCDPRYVFVAVSELIGNITASTVQSMLDDEGARQEIAERITGRSFDVVMMAAQQDAMMVRDAAERDRPKLAVVPKDMEAGSNVVPLNGKGKPGA